MIKDNVSGLIWSESYPVTGTAAASTTANWSAAVQMCNDLTYGGRSDWRLPTQMELMDAYNHGIREVGYNGAGTQRPGGDTLVNNNYFIADTDANYFWSASSQSNFTTGAWYVNLHFANTASTTKIGSYLVVCVAP